MHFRAWLPETERVGKPAICLVAGHDISLPNLIECLMSPYSEITQVTVCGYAQRLLRSRMSTDIGVAAGESVADIHLPVIVTVAVDIGSWPQRHRRTAVGTPHWLSFALSFLFLVHWFLPPFELNWFAVLPDLRFCLSSLRFSGYPPFFEKIICKQFVNEPKNKKKDRR